MTIIRQVLVVDDTPANLIAFEAALEPIGCAVVKAASGEQALSRVLEQDFSLVLLDVHMPGMDGFETARWIRSRERSAHVPIVFISAFSRDDEGVLHAYELGAVDFLFKPVYPQVLRAKVQVFIDLQAHQEEVVALRIQREFEAKRRAYEIETNEELVRLNKTLRALDRSRDRSFGALAHDLRAPLAAIRSVVEGSQAIAEIGKLDKLADDLLELSQVGSSEIKIRFEPIDLRSIVEDALANTRHLIEAKSVELAIKLGDRPIIVNADRDRLVQAATNLLLNAHQTTPERGKVGIACVANDRFGLVIVEDNGAGIPADLLPEIFAGPALGLAIAHRLVSHHDGVLTASSGGANQGSTFVIKLPRS